jgi:hypothetical protein
MQWVAGVGAASERGVAYVGGLAELFVKSLRLLFVSPLKRSRMLQRPLDRETSSDRAPRQPSTKRWQSG